MIKRDNANQTPEHVASGIVARPNSRPLTVRLLGTGEIRAHVDSVLKQVTDPPLMVVGTAEPGENEEDCASELDATMVIVESAGLEALSQLRRRKSQSEAGKIFAVLRDRAPVTMRRALQAGADELLLLPLDISNLTRALLNISEIRRTASGNRGGIVCSVTSNTGGVGVTSLVGSLGVALSRNLNKSVGLLDLHLQAGALSVFLNVGVGATIMSMAEGTRALDSIKLDSVLIRHSSGAHLLAAPNKVEESELVPQDTINGVVGLMRQLFDFVLVDCGSYIDARIASVWEQSDRLFYVIDQSIIAARSASRFLDVFDRLGIESLRPEFILNKFSPEHPITEIRLAEALTQAIFATVPCDPEALNRVHIMGTDLWTAAPDSQVTRKVQALAEALVDPRQRTAEGSSEGLISRLFWRRLGSNKNSLKTKRSADALSS